MPFELRLTDLGRAALADGTNRGTNAVRLTKMAIGDGQGPGGAADDGRAALRNQRAVAALGGTTTVSGRIAVRGEFAPDAAYGVSELGLLGQVGAGAEELYAYWTDDGELLASTVDGTRLVIAGSLDVAPAAAEVSVTVDASISLGDPALSATVTALGGRLDTAETDIDALEAADFAALITALTTRLDTAESDIDALENRSVIRGIYSGSVSGSYSGAIGSPPFKFGAVRTLTTAVVPANTVKIVSGVRNLSESGDTGGVTVSLHLTSDGTGIRVGFRFGNPTSAAHVTVSATVDYTLVEYQ